MQECVAAGVVPAGYHVHAGHGSKLPVVETLQVLQWLIMDLLLQIKHLLQNDAEESLYSCGAGRQKPFCGLILL